MRKKSLLLTLFAASIFVTVFVAYTGGWGGVRATGGSLHVSGEGYGLGQVDQAQINARLDGYLICVNHGTNIAPGQNSYTTILEQTQNVTVRNGKFSFNFDFTDDDLGLAPSDWEAAGCPNPNWTVDYLHDRLEFTLHEIEQAKDGSFIVVERTAASFSCVMNPPALSGEYVCTQL